MSKVRQGLSFKDAGRLGAIRTNEMAQERRSREIMCYDANPKLCPVCGLSIPYSKRKNKYCSHRCSAIASNKSTHRKNEKACEFCGKKITGKHRRFCSNTCSSKFFSKQREDKLNEYIEQTGEFPRSHGVCSGEVYRKTVKRYLIKKFGNKCSICGTSVWMGKPIPLVVDHIDGDAFNCKIDNFRLVCGNCDMQLPTYKGKNIGHGRAWRKLYS